MSDAQYLTRKEAAVACGRHEDTIRRYQRDGKLANTRTRGDGTVEVAVADLVAAGLLDPLTAGVDVAEMAGRSRAERDLLTARQDLALAAVRIEALTAQLTDRDSEIDFLRSLLTKVGA